jgi:hypothetical protein
MAIIREQEWMSDGEAMKYRDGDRREASSVVEGRHASPTLSKRRYTEHPVQITPQLFKG